LKVSDWNSGIYLLLGMSFETGCLFLIISRIKWMQNAVVLVVLQGYIWCRGIDHEKNPSVQKPAFITLAVYIIILPLFCYSGEKEDRKVFLKTQQQQEELKCYESLIKSVFPTCIIIFTKGKLVFSNRRAHDTFRTKSEKELISILSSLMVLRKKLIF
jgi:hypothetical protein